MPVSITHKILRNTGWNFIARAIHIPVSIGLIPFIIEQVGMEWYGVWVTLFAIVDYVSLLDLGVGAATIKYVAEYQASGNYGKIANVVLSTCLFNLIFLPPLLLGYVFADEILSVFQIAPKDVADARIIFDWVLLNFAAVQMGGVFRNTLIGLQRMHISNLCEIAYLLAYAVSAVVVLGAGVGLTVLVAVLFVLRCGLMALQAGCLLYALPHLTPRSMRVDTAMLREFFCYGLKLHTTSLAGLVNFQLDKLLIGHFLRMEFVAFYELGSKLATTVRLVPSFVMGPLVPAASELAVRQDFPRLKELYWQGTRYMALMAAPAAGFLIANAALIIPLWLGEGSHAYATAALQTLSIGYFFNIITGTANSIGRGTGVLRYEIEATALLSILNALLCVTLIIRLGFPGALLGTGLSMIAGNSFYLLRFSLFMRCDYKALFAQVLAKPIICSITAGLASSCVVNTVGDAAVAQGRPEIFLCLISSSAVFAVVLFAGLFATGALSRSDAQLVRQTLMATKRI
jgi:O-antigen/teichoic acid export membrane protein